MVGGSMAGKLGRKDKMDIRDILGKTDMDIEDVFFYDVFHNCHSRSHRRICHLDRNQIVA